MSANPLVGILSALEQMPVLDTATRDVLGNNLPKIALTRSSTERMDVAISNIGNTLSFLVGGSAVDLMLKKAFSKVQSAHPVNSTAYRWAVLARSLGIYSTMASTMWAMPFIRNYIVTKKTGSVSFSDVIQSGRPVQANSLERKAALDASLKDSKNKALTILGLGAAGIAAPLLVAKWGIRSGNQAAGKLLNRFAEGRWTKGFMLEGGLFSKLGGIPSMLFWGLPAYFGWYHASRDPYEKQEVFIRAVNFVACFFGPAPLLNKAFKGKFEKQFPKLEMTFNAVKSAAHLTPQQKVAAENFLVKKNLLSVGVSTLLLGVTPQLLNIFLTNRRLKKDVLLKKQAVSVKSGQVALAAAPNVLPAAAALPPGQGLAGLSAGAYGSTQTWGPMNPQASANAPFNYRPAWPVSPVGLGSRSAFS